MTGSPRNRDHSSDSWVEQWLSAPRLRRYLAESGGDQERALDLYEWNLRLGAALMRDIAHFEVALRNAYDRVMCERWPGEHWLFDPASPILAPLWRTRRSRRADLNARNRTTVADAVRRCGGQTAKPGEVIAELSFGFWRHCTDAAHEKTIWVPYLHHTWPKKTSRVVLERTLTTINTARNRASHHEPLFGNRPGRDLADAHRGILHLSELLLPELASYLRDTTTVTRTLAERP
ncbi:Abi family protein [Brevibacterium moorei]|uniref:Abi family protein n=1 Tax=Brevibacterium moorei TaxID=2968457 RepID=UPI00211C5C53|nr:Abi family protein [Brevibacterium sp. 68QC2CO]MCQ9385744.1 Abi family protein [Brevibacterium sp. 68QC2CO]